MGLNPKLPGGEGARDEGMVSISPPVSIVMLKEPKQLSGFSQKARGLVCPLTDGAS